MQASFGKEADEHIHDVRWNPHISMVVIRNPHQGGDHRRCTAAIFLGNIPIGNCFIISSLDLDQ